jgi:hypothetical protein
MRSLLARLAVLGAFAVSVSACSSGHDSSLPIAGPPNNNGGSIANLQTGANGTALIRFVQGSPDVGQVDVCIDATPAVGGLQVSSTPAAVSKLPFKGSALIGVAGGIPHVVSVYLSSIANGAACPTAPGPFNGTAPIAFTTVPSTVNTRMLIALGGRAGKNLGLYAYTSPTFATPPTGPAAIGYNDAPSFGAVAFGTIATTGGTPTTLPGLTNVPAPTKTATPAALPSPIPAGISAPLASVPAAFYDAAAATPTVPVTTVPVPTVSTAPGFPTPGQAYVVDLIAVDSAAAAKLDLVLVTESTTGYGF